MSIHIPTPKIHKLTQADLQLIRSFVKTNTQDLPEGFFSSYPTPESIDNNNVFGIFSDGNLASIAQAKFGENMTSTDEMLEPVLPHGVKKTQIAELGGWLTGYDYRGHGLLRTLVQHSKESIKDTRTSALTFCHIANAVANAFAQSGICGDLVKGDFDFFGDTFNIYREDFTREEETHSLTL